MLKLLVVFLFTLYCLFSFAQLDTIHYLPPLHSREDASIKEHYVYLSTPETVAFSVDVKDGSGSHISGSPFTISNTSPAEIYIEKGQTSGSKLMVEKSELNTVFTDRGLSFYGEKRFYVNARYRDRDRQAGSLTSKGLKSLGNTFRIGYAPMIQENTSKLSRNFVIGIMATEDNTQINISDYDSGVVFTGGVDVTDDQLDITLNAGNTIVLSGYMDVSANLTGMLGALVESDKPIAISNGSWLGTISDSKFSQDICIDQIVPVDNLGYIHIPVMAEGEAEDERPMVVAHYDNTQVFLNGSVTPDTTLSAGGYFLINNSFYSGTTHKNMLIETSQPAYVYQFMAGDLNDQTGGMNFLPPLTCNLPNAVDLIPSIEKIGTETYDGGVYVISQLGGAVSINGVLQTDPMPVTGSTDWETYKVLGITGDTKVESDKSVAIGFFGYSSAAGYGGYFSGFSSTFQAKFTMADSICLDETFDINFTGDTIAGLNVTWDFGTTDVTSTINNNYFPVDVDYLNSGTYEIVLAMDFDNCESSYSKSIVVNPLPTATISGTTALCVGGASPDITFTGANGTAPYTFTYNINGGANTTVTSAGVTDVATVSASTATDGAFTYNLVSVEDASSTNCSQLQTGSAIVTIEALPTATISGTTTICEASTSPDITFTGANGTAPYTFTYNINGGTNTTVTSVGITDVATVSANTSSDGTFTYNLVSVEDASTNTCSQTQTGSAIVTINSSPTATISGTTTVFVGDANPAVTFTAANGTAPYTFTYNINGGANTTITSAGVTDVVTVSVSTAADGIFTYNLVSVSDASANNCSQLQTGSANVTVNPLTTISSTVSGSTTICKGATSPDITFTGSDGTAPYTFTYNINGGANTTVTSTGITDVATVSVNTSSDGIFTYNLVNVEDDNANSEVQTGSAIVTIDPLPTATISGATTICEGATNPDVTFTGANGTAPYTFTYNINGGANTTITSSGVTDVAIVNASSTSDGTFTYNLVSVADASTNACTQLQTGSATVTIDPLPTASVSGTTTICEASTSPDITFTGANGTAPYTFTYNINGGTNTTVTSVGITDEATLSASTASDGTFTYNLVSVLDASTNTCSQTQTGSAIVTINSSPTATISGTTSVFVGDGNPDITFTAANGSAPYTFTYNINGGANTTITSAGVTDVVTVSVSTAADGIFTYNLVSVSDASANNCSQLQTGSANVTVNPLTTISSTVSGSTTICKGATSPDITFTGSDGTAPYTFTYNINGGANTTVTSTGITDVATVSVNTSSDGIFTYNLVNVEDDNANSEVQTGSAIVTIDPLPTATISGATTICEGATNPDVTFTGANGTAPYTFTYNINGGANTTITSSGVTDVAIVNASSTSDGTFTYNLVSVADASTNACTQLQTGSATVTIDPLPTATISGTTTICENATSPDIIFTGTNGTAPYTFTYNINGGTNTTVTSTGITDVATVSVSTSTDGTFTYNLVSVSDASINNCNQVQTGSAIVTIDPLPTATISGTTTICEGETNPDITFTGLNGTAPYTFTYNINGGTNTTITSVGVTDDATVSLSSTTDGTFTYNLVSVSDASTNNCSQVQSGSAIVTIDPLPTATISGNNTVCVGELNPNITFSGSNGTAPYTFTYNINGGTNTTVTSTGTTDVATVSVSTTTNGTFTYNLVSVSDASANNCSQLQTGSSSVTVNLMPTASISGTTTICMGATNPDITFTGANGTAPYTFTYNINGGVSTTVTSDGITDIATLIAITTIDGIFTYNLLSVSDASSNNCSQIQTGSSIVTVTPSPIASISGSTTLCVGASDPDLTFIGSNGTAPYTFTYNINGGASTTITSPGVTDVATINASSTSEGTFTYNLIGVTDAGANSCFPLSGNATITIDPSPTATISGTTTICKGATNPDITFTGVNGTAPYTFTYNINGGTNTTVTSSVNTAVINADTDTDGIFTYNLVSVADASNTQCSQVQTGTAIVTVTPSPTATILGTTSICVGATSPEITFKGANGTAPYTFTYNINGGTSTTATSPGVIDIATVNASSAYDGNYTYNLIAVADAASNSCAPLSDNITISVNSSPTATISGTTTICEGETNPNITFTGANGTAPYTFTYNINGGANTTTTSSGDVAIIGVNTDIAGTFDYNLVSVEDASVGNCSQAQTGTATVTINPLPTAIISGTTAACEGATSPDITFTGANGTAPYTFTYNINGGANITVTATGTSDLATINASTSTNGTFSYNLVSVSDASSTNCSQVQTGTATVTVNTLPTATISGNTTICEGATNPDITFTGANGTAPYTFTYNLNGGTNTTVTATGTSDVATVSVSTSTDGTFTYNLVSVSDASTNNCSQLQAGSVIVTIEPLPTATISGTTTACEGVANPDVTFTGASGTAPYTFTYNINGGSNTTVTSAGITDIATVSATTASAGTFTYNLVSVSDASSNNCSQVQSGLVIVSIDPLPTATISGTTTICEGATSPDITFTGANGTYPYTFTYNINGGANTTVTSAGTTNIATVTASTSTDGVFTYSLVSVSDASTNNCSQVQIGSTIVTVEALPTATISGATNICMGATSPDVTFTGANGTAPYIFTYNINGGANTTATSDGTTDVATISASTSSDGTFTYNLVSVSDASTNNCSQIQTSSTVITVTPSPTATISGTTTTCIGATSPDITFTGANGTAPYTFTYNINGGSNMTVTSVGNSALISANTVSEGEFNYNLIAIEDAASISCSPLSGIATVTVNPLLNATIAGTTTICMGAIGPDITLTGTNGTAPYTFTYNINGGANTTVTSTGNTAVISASTTTNGNYTYNLVSITDANSNTCSQTLTGNCTVTVTLSPTASISGNTTICENETSPDITFTGANGIAPYTFTYNINGGANMTVTSPGITDVATVSVSTASTGTFNYNLIGVADDNANSCSPLSGTATVIVNPLPTATISGTTTVCEGETSPDITFTGANGTAPYTFTYNINGGVNTTVSSTGTTDVATVSANTTTDGTFIYNLVSVLDASSTNCTQLQTGSATVTIDPLPTATVSGATTICVHASSPEITFTGANGTAPYIFTYNINGGANTTVTSVGNSAVVNVNTATSGTFTYNLLSVEDASTNNCSQAQTSSVSVIINPLPTATISGTTTICEGDSSPEVTFTGANGTAPYTFTYNINGGANTTVTSTGTSDIATVNANTSTEGSFTYNLISVTDASSSSCSQIQNSNATVTVDPLPTATVSGTTTICKGETNPEITFTGANGTAPYTFTYNINGGANTTVTSIGKAAVVSVSSSTSGIYNYNLISVSDGRANACSQVQTGTVTVTIDPLPTATISGTTTVCEGETNPDITFTGTNGTAPYTFTYNINGGANTTVTSTGTTDVATVSANTTIDGIFTYNLISVEDASINACSKLQNSNATVTVDPLPTATISGGTTICMGESDPDITFTGFNGTAPYTFTYNVNGGANTTITSTGNTAIISVSSAIDGAFTYNLVSVSDASINACTQVQTGNTTVTVNPLPTAAISGTITTCVGETNPDITFTGANGTAPYTFTYNINGGTDLTVTSNGTSDIATVTGTTIGAGTFIYNLISVTDATINTCSQGQIGDATITVNPLPTAIISGTTTICENATSPDITFIGANGTAPYTFTYNINGGANTTVTSNGTTGIATVSALTNTDGTFTYNLVSVSDASPTSCSQLQTGAVTVTVDPLPTASISGTTAICLGETNPEVIFTGANGTTPYTFTYNINGGVNSTVTSNGNTVTINASSATDGSFVYNLISVSDASINNCSQTQTADATIVINPLPIINLTSNTTEECQEACIDFETITTINSGTVNQVESYVIGNNNLYDQATFQHCFQDSGRYDIAVEAISDQGCIVKDTFPDFIQIYQTPEAYVEVDETIKSIIDPTFNFTNNSINADSIIWYYDYLFTGKSNDQYLTLNVTDTGSYEVILLASSDFGCVDTAAITIRVVPEFLAYFPNSFSPNEDGINDTWFPVISYGAKEDYQLYIFNRWGELIYESKDSSAPWNGYVNGLKNQVKVQDGVYIYKAVVYDLLGNEYFFNGHITIVR